MLDKLQKDIETKLLASGAFGEEKLPAVELNPAPEHTGADISVNWAMSVVKILKKKPLEIAKTAAQLITEVTGVDKAAVVPPGFINITLTSDFIAKAAMDRRIKDRSLAGSNKEKILIEFVSANPTGPLHVASGRGASLGDSLVRVFNALGHNTDAEYYVNDAGNQAEMLGKSLRARVEGSDLPENGYHGEYLIEMAEEIKTKSKGWTDAEYSAYAIEYLLSQQKEDMKAFNVEFTRWFRESELYKDNLPSKTLKFLEEKGQTYERDGAVWFGTTQSSEGDDDKDRVLVRKDGRPTYFLADIAYHKNKYDRGYSKLIDILGADHHGYVPRMKAAVGVLGQSQDSFVPVVHQLVHLIEGGQAVKMSKRSGRFITLRELVEEVSTDVCRFFFASRTPNAHMNFDIDLAKKKTNENPVFYVQYVHARTTSIIKNAEQKGLVSSETLPSDFAPQERALLVKLLWFKKVLRTCIKDLSVHHITSYLVELSALFHSFYDSCRVIDESAQETTAYRLMICQRIKERISKALELIGVSAPDEM
ncbi:arginyl-tRNA synthetase [Parelusimicrobium proximum]|uniref:arginine--tRNA ligase n=1 Tax=Parelusimicrobium proximum TaxID=3228953 RepID=UPI003D182CC3